LHRSLNLAERIGDTPLMSVVFHNLGEVAASSGDLTEAEALYRQSLTLAEQINDREYISLWNANLAIFLQEQNRFAEVEVYICRALTIGRAMRNLPCIGIALVALGNLRIAQAKAASQAPFVTGEEGNKAEVQDASLLTRDPAMRFLKRAKMSLGRALILEKLEAETRTRAQLALAHVALLEGQLEAARQQAVQAMREAGRNELMGLLPRCQQLLEEIGRV
jgi:tetratricopeptide (TPR) repeat protein